MTQPGDKHYTASAIILSDSHPAKVLLLHHKKIDKWIQPGGHQEAFESAYEGAIREAKEETGIDITDYIAKPVRLDEFSVQLPLPDLMLDEHIDAYGTEPEHYHLDMMYIVRVPEQSVLLEAGKAHDIRWFTLEEVETLKTFEELRMTLRREMAEPTSNVHGSINLPKPYSFHETDRGVYFFYDVDLSFLPAEIEFGGTKFVRSALPHCSLIALDAIIPQLMDRDGLTRSQAIQRGVEAVVSAIEALKPRVTRYRPEFRLADKPEKGNRSIVAMVDLEHNTEFQQRVGEALGVTIPPRPAHVTLYTLENGNPIPLGTPEQLEQYSRTLTAAELAEPTKLIPVEKLLEITP